MTNDDNTAGKIFQRVFQRPQGVDIQIVRRFIQQEDGWGIDDRACELEHAGRPVDSGHLECRRVFGVVARHERTVRRHGDRAGQRCDRAGGCGLGTGRATEDVLVPGISAAERNQPAPGCGAGLERRRPVAACSGHEPGHHLRGRGRAIQVKGNSQLPLTAGMRRIWTASFWPRAGIR